MIDIIPNTTQSYGVLVLDKVTPIIRALFRAYQLGELRPGSRELTFRFDREYQGTTPPRSTWHDIMGALANVASDLGVPPAASPVGLLASLAARFDRSPHVVVEQFTEICTIKAAGTPTLEQIFKLAWYLDDGHGLIAIRATSLGNGSERFGGTSVYASAYFGALSSTEQTLQFAHAVHGALLNGDLNAAADHFIATTEKLLSGVTGSDDRNELRSRLAKALSGAPSSSAAPAHQATGSTASTAKPARVSTSAALKLIGAINRTGGVIWVRPGACAPAVAKKWTALGDAYSAACDEQGVLPRWFYEYFDDLPDTSEVEEARGDADADPSI